MIQNEEISALLKKARSKLKTATIDFEAGQLEDSISRCYYAVFHSITALLLTKELSFTSHSQTIGNFNRHFVKEAIFPKEFTLIIQGLFEDRQTSDYDAITSFLKSNVMQSIHDTSRVLDSIESYIENLLNK